MCIRDSVITDTYGNLCIGNASGLCEFTDTNLVSGSNYNYRVLNTNAGGNSDWSTEADGWTLASPPSNLNISYTINSANELTLTWNAPTGTVTGYQIERMVGVGTTFTVVEPNYQSLSYTDTGLALSETYTYRISSINLGGIGIHSPEVSQVTASPPDAPTNLTLTIKDDSYVGCPAGTYQSPLNSNAGYCILLEWTAPSVPSGTSGASIDGYKVERSTNGGSTWTEAVANTGNALTEILDTGLQGGQDYQYRVSTITIIGTGLPSNEPTKTLVDGTFVVAGTAVGGKTVTVTPQLSITSGSPTSTVSDIRLYTDPTDPQLDQQTVNAQQLTGSTTVYTDFYQYPTVATDYFAWIFIQQDDAQFAFQSNTVNITPTTSYSGNVLLTENRNQTSTGFSESTFDLTATPTNFDAILVYQHADPTMPKEYHLYENIQANVTDAITVEPNSDYYISVYLNPTEFDYTLTGNTTQVTLECNNESPANCEDGQIPLGIRSDFVVRSLKSPDAQTQLGLEGLGGLFGIPMIFLFIIGLSAVFTTRSSHMGIIFIAVALGLMAYLGYLSFDNVDTTSINEDTATWAIIIVVTVIGLFIGKRWS